MTWWGTDRWLLLVIMNEMTAVAEILNRGKSRCPLRRDELDIFVRVGLFSCGFCACWRIGRPDSHSHTHSSVTSDLNSGSDSAWGKVKRWMDADRLTQFQTGHWSLLITHKELSLWSGLSSSSSSSSQQRHSLFSSSSEIISHLVPKSD